MWEIPIQKKLMEYLVLLQGYENLHGHFVTDRSIEGEDIIHLVNKSLHFPSIKDSIVLILIRNRFQSRSLLAPASLCEFWFD